ARADELLATNLRRSTPSKILIGKDDSPKNIRDKVALRFDLRGQGRRLANPQRAGHVPHDPLKGCPFLCAAGVVKTAKHWVLLERVLPKELVDKELRCLAERLEL